MENELILCDTDVIIDFFDRDKPRHQSTYDLILPLYNENLICVSVITVMEVLSGLTNKAEWKRGSEQLAALNSFLITPECSLRALNLMQAYRLSHGLSIPDALIAATALELVRPLFTYNKKHFKFIKGLRLWNPGK